MNRGRHVVSVWFDNPPRGTPPQNLERKHQQARVRSRQRVHLSRVEGRSLPRLLSMISGPSCHQHFCIEASRIVYVRENIRKISRLAVASRLGAQWSRGRVSCAATPPLQSHFETSGISRPKKNPEINALRQNKCFTHIVWLVLVRGVGKTANRSEECMFTGKICPGIILLTRQSSRVPGLRWVHQCSSQLLDADATANK